MSPLALPTLADSASSSGVRCCTLRTHAMPPFFKKACVDSCYDARIRFDEMMCSVTQSPANRLISGPEPAAHVLKGTSSVGMSHSISSQSSNQHIHSLSVSSVSLSGCRFAASPNLHSVGRAIVQMRQSQ